MRALLAVLAGLGAGYARELSGADFTDEEGAIRLVEEFPIDLCTRMGGLRYADLLGHRRIHGGDVPVPFLDAAGLVRRKSGSPRPQDRHEVEVLRRLAAA